MASTAITSFSHVQTTLLSKEAPATMPRPACSRSAVSSTTTGGLPGPAAITFLPEAKAAFTTAGPPVTTTNRMPGARISSLADSMVGSVIQQRRFAGAPSATSKRFMRSIAKAVVCLADGCALKTTALPPEIMPIPLLMTDSEGLVEGVMAPITPHGASSSRQSPCWPETASARRISGPGVLLMTSRFFLTLSSKRPIPVSWTAKVASSCTRRRRPSRRRWMISIRRSRPMDR